MGNCHVQIQSSAKFVSKRWRSADGQTLPASCSLVTSPRRCLWLEYGRLPMQIKVSAATAPRMPDPLLQAHIDSSDRWRPQASQVRNRRKGMRKKKRKQGQEEKEEGKEEHKRGKRAGGGRGGKLEVGDEVLG
eukprot:749858-Hanusia_phi.AAC.5